MKIYIVVILISLVLILPAKLQAISATSFTPDIKKTLITWGTTQTLKDNQANIHIGADAVCGYYTNEAQYASYGLETQIFKYSKIVIPININYNNFFACIDFAPLYDSIKSEDPQPQVPSFPCPKQDRNIYINFDWYKNLGTRNYYLGGSSLIEAYVGYQISQHHSIIMGRIKNEVGLLDSNTIWNDDGLFSPMSYWLSRDLYTGIAYHFESKYINFRAKILSGNNPMKGYANYLNHIQSPNIKANNTPTYSINVDINLNQLTNLNDKSKLTFGFMKNIINSTWDQTIKPKPDGKRRNHVVATGAIIGFLISDNCSAELFAQYTWYLSGLSELSNQNDHPSKFMDITQSGYFTGATLTYNKLAVSYTYESFDRFDANIYHLFDNKKFLNNLTLDALKKLKQSSHIVNIKYLLTDYISIKLDYHYIYNPLKWTSYIMNNHSDDRFALTLNITLD